MAKFRRSQYNEGVLLLLILLVRSIHPQDSFTQTMNHLKMEASEASITLENVLNFLLSHGHQLNVDGAFGVVIAQVQLEEALNIILSHNGDSQIVNFFYGLIGKCATIINKVMQLIPRHAQQSEDYLKIASKLLNPSIWNSPPQIYAIRPFDTRPFEWTAQDLFNTTFHGGSPVEVESDKCIVDLLDNTDGVPGKQFYCGVSPYCRRIMFEQGLDATTGYALSHRLLYLLIGRALHCTGWDSSVRQISWDYCNQMHREMVTIERFSFPYGQRDLFLEQVMLCGLEGYTHFWKPTWTRIIGSWQNQAGCYGIYSHQAAKRKRRETLPMDYGCDSHYTGLAAATLALNLKRITQHQVNMVSGHNPFA